MQNLIALLAKILPSTSYASKNCNRAAGAFLGNLFRWTFLVPLEIVGVFYAVYIVCYLSLLYFVSLFYVFFQRL